MIARRRSWSGPRLINAWIEKIPTSDCFSLRDIRPNPPAPRRSSCSFALGFRGSRGTARLRKGPPAPTLVPPPRHSCTQWPLGLGLEEAARAARRGGIAVVWLRSGHLSDLPQTTATSAPPPLSTPQYLEKWRPRDG